MQRYSEFVEYMIGRNGKRRYETLYYPRIEEKETDLYIITKSVTRLDLLASQYYGDVRYWVIIARENNLNNATLRIPPGLRLRIPYPLDINSISDQFREAQF